MYGSILGAVLLALQYSGDLFKQYAILSLDLSVALLIKLDGLLVAHRLLQQEARHIWAIIVNAGSHAKDPTPMLVLILFKKGLVDVSLGVNDFRGSQSPAACLLADWLNNQKEKVTWLVKYYWVELMSPKPNWLEESSSGNLL
jgi:hypothetical protein